MGSRGQAGIISAMLSCFRVNYDTCLLKLSDICSV